MIGEQSQLALGLITVYCFACPHTVTGTTPDAAHDLMEQHFTDAHAALIRRFAS